MLYYLFQYLNEINVPGAGMFTYITFRSAMAVITSLIISMIIGKRIITFLQVKQVGEVVRDLGLEGQYQKKGTPSMGGVIILASIIIPVLLFAKLDNIYVILMLLTTIWLGFIGFMDDYIKVFKKNKEGLAARSKVAGQIILGIIVGLTLFFSKDVILMEKVWYNLLSGPGIHGRYRPLALGGIIAVFAIMYTEGASYSHSVRDFLLSRIYRW